jgi:hypothetical protein
MRRAVRENALCAFMAGAGTATMAWLGLYGFAWNDYDNEARAALAALVHGHVLDFLRLAPAYGGSLVERAPFALVPGLWGGGELAVYRMVALPCLLAACVLGVWLVSRMRTEGRSVLARAVTLGVCVANPVVLRALELGHPEELLGACLCVAAVLLAGRDRPLWAGVLLGLAVANKYWALLAVGPVLLALPPGRRLRSLASAGALAAAVLAPLALVGSGGFLAQTRAAASSAATIFQPWQAWWFVGHHGALVHGLFGTPKPGYRTGPAWTGAISHPLILAAGLALTAAVWLRLRRAGAPIALPPTITSARRAPAFPPSGTERTVAGALPVRDALLALALALLLRCVLDTWDNVYYLLPAILALLAWEIRGPLGRPPVLALASTVVVWISFQWLPSRVSPDAQAALFLAWSLPLAAALGVWLFKPRRSELREPAWIAWPRRSQGMTVSALDRVVRASLPSFATTTRSSIRTPRRPGR